MENEISIHSAARAETHQGRIRLHREPDFNPLRREGGDMNGAVDYLVEKGISIHSAARAETIPWRKSIMSIRISIHSAARAETR